MIRIAITLAAFDAIAATLPLGSVSYENHVNERGERYVWLRPTWSTASGPSADPARATATLFCGSRRGRDRGRGHEHHGLFRRERLAR
jgi:hypothetical protein